MDFIFRLLKDALALDEKPLIDRAHQSLRPKPRDGERPRDIILRGEDGDSQRFSEEPAISLFQGQSFSIYQDYFPTVSKQRTAFAQVKRLLRDHPGVMYGLRFPARLMMVKTTHLILQMRLWLTFNVTSRRLELSHRSANVA
jgi:hypothetical protein